MKFFFGTEYIKLQKGTKHALDYTLHWSNNVKFTDEHLFNNLLNNFNTKEDFYFLLEHLKSCGFITFYPNKISTFKSGLANSVPFNNLKNYIDNLNLTDSAKLYLFSFILRIDIDNICYQKDSQNGGIRIFIQTLLCFAYFLDISSYKFLPISNSTDKEKINKSVYALGYNLPSIDFNTSYTNWYNKHYILI